MQPNSPYSLPSIVPVQSSNPLGSWQLQPYQLNSSGSVPGATNLNYQNRLLIGFLPDGSYGMWVSQIGVPVASATASQLIFNSSQDIFKIVKKLSMPLSFTLPDSGAHQYSVSQAHGFNGTPAYSAFADVVAAGGSFRSLVPSMEFSPAAYSTLIPSIVKEIWVDGTNVKIQVSTQGIVGSYNYTFTVYILQETAN